MTTFIFGEAMLEYHCQGGAGLRYGGDTLNTAIHLARAGHAVCYVTALGSDPISDAMVAAWQADGIDTRFVLRHPERSPGIYAIRLDDAGERHFLYWRGESAASDMASLPGFDEAILAAEEAGLLYFSLISLAILGDAGRTALLDLAARRKRAGRAVAYDSNFRPSLWPDHAAAQSASLAAMQACTLGLPTNSDERELWSTQEADDQIARRWIEESVSQVAVKAGERGCLLGERQGHEVTAYPATPTEVVDSSGAGDAFNGGFLSAWLDHKTAEQCVFAGQQQARQTLGHHGAIQI